MPTIDYSDCATAEGLTDFQKKVCEHAVYYKSLQTKLYLTDFNPLTVDWTTPVPWGNDPEDFAVRRLLGERTEPSRDLV